ncbi:DUF6192 family protein [Sphaerisporangium rhizosphaerae]|uniref:DUF6192 family protein n=1 Tax=Sphaerisporangium rhizosphaerae TaxID=2269375 RepID=A0ABW2PCT2_9ACTN
MADKIGNVTQRRFDEMVDQASDMVRKIGVYQFAMGDMALEIEPMRPPRTGRNEGVRASMRLFAEEIGESVGTVLTWRWVANAWPADQRCEDASYTVHRVMASHPDRFMLVREPPLAWRGRRRWTEETAAKAVGRVSTITPYPLSPAVVFADSLPDPFPDDESLSDDIEAAEDKSLSGEVVSVGEESLSGDMLPAADATQQIHQLPSDDAAASTMVAELLSRPEVAGRVMADPNTRRQLYQAQHDHDQQVQEAARERTPAIKHVDHSIHFLDLIGTGHAFVAGINRLMPQIKDNPLAQGERDAIHHVLDQAQAAIDFCRSVINVGHLTMEEEWAKVNEEEP